MGDLLWRSSYFHRVKWGLSGAEGFVGSEDRVGDRRSLVENRVQVLRSDLGTRVT